MLTFKEIKETTDKYGIGFFDTIYDNKEHNADSLNNEIIRKIIMQINSNLEIKDDLLLDWFAYLLKKINNSDNQMAINTLKKLLEMYHYNPKSEIGMFIVLADLFFTGQITYENLIRDFNSWQTFRNVKTLNNGLLIDSSYGKMHFVPASYLLGISDIDLDLRHRHCHNLTGQFITDNPSFYGTYYHMPYSFKGTFAHSIILDENESLTFDLANNVAMPIKHFNYYAPSYIFKIKGQDFKDLSTQFEEEYGQPFRMDMLETIQELRR